MICKENTRSNPCGYAPKIKLQLLADLVHPYAHVQGFDLMNNKTVVDQVVNVCTMLKHTGLDIFLKIMFELLVKNFQFEMKCPFKNVNPDEKLKLWNHLAFFLGTLWKSRFPERLRPHGEFVSAQSSPTIHRNDQKSFWKNNGKRFSLSSRFRSCWNWWLKQ